MAKTTVKSTDQSTSEGKPIFPKENYKFMLIGLVVIIIGFLLMTGGASTDSNTFKPSDVYSFRRITLAPTVIVLGLLIEVYAIMRRPKTNA